MDATAGDMRKAPLPSDGAPPTSAPEVRDDAPLCEQAVPVAGAGGAAVESGSGSEDDEQVERFYALLANIRALRNVYGGGGGWSKKRARGAQEPPWRPAFRMEDFREVDDAVRPTKERRDDVGRQRPEDDPAAEDEEDGEVVEEKDRVSASQRARARTDQLVV